MGEYVDEIKTKPRRSEAHLSVEYPCSGRVVIEVGIQDDPDPEAQPAKKLKRHQYDDAHVVLRKTRYRVLASHELAYDLSGAKLKVGGTAVVGHTSDSQDLKVFSSTQSKAVGARIAFKKVTENTVEIAEPTFLGAREESREQGLGRVGTWGSFVLWAGKSIFKVQAQKLQKEAKQAAKNE